MKSEYSCGAVLYRKNNSIYEYLIIKDRHDCYSFPKGHMKKDETDRECAVREIYEEVGLKVDPDPYFQYVISYDLNNNTKKSVSYFMADIEDKIPFINDGEVKEILFLPYEKACELLSYGQLKDVLKEVNERLVSDMKICCMFADDAKFERRNLEHIKSFGDTFEGHQLYMWDEGDRTLYRCRKCGGYVLEQHSEIHMPDTGYTDYVPVRDEKHTEQINREYGPLALETEYPYKKIFYTAHYD